MRNPLKADPSRTYLIRRAFQAEMQKRFDAIRIAVWRYVVTENQLQLYKPTHNTGWTDEAREASIAARRANAAGGVAEGKYGTPESFKIMDRGGVAMGSSHNADFPNDKVSPTRGDLFYVEVPREKRRQGLGEHLALRALALMHKRGATSVTMHSVTKEGAGLAAKLVKLGHLSGPIRTSESGKAEYKIESFKKTQPASVKNARYSFPTKDKKVRAFNTWLKRQVDNGILQVSLEGGEQPGQQPWLYKYITSAYKQGATRAYIDSRPDANDPINLPLVAEATRKGFLESSFNRPERVDKLKLLYTRSYEDLKGVTAAMSTKMSRVLTDGMARGDGVQPIARKLAAEVKDITRKRALVIARTEVIHAHAEGQLDGMEDLGITETEAEVEFSTAGDDGVCPICEALQGKVYKVAEAHGIIPVHPNCRCSWMPHIVVPKFKRVNGKIVLVKS